VLSLFCTHLLQPPIRNLSLCFRST
jgi:hypothetical protein